jgi:prephenate dehydrogenase
MQIYLPVMKKNEIETNWNDRLNVGIIGLGLMGASFALALKQIFKNCLIAGWDIKPDNAQKALELNIVDSISDNMKDIFSLDLIILAVPVKGIVNIISQISDIAPTSTIIDLGSTKKPIIRSVPPEYRLNFIAAHPMAGTEKSGPEAALPDLYKNKVMVVCNIEESGEKQKEFAEYIFKKMQMNIVYMDAEEHDKHAAVISHLPHAISFSIANSIMKQENPESITALAGGGFRDVSRIAKTPPDMWIDIFSQNKNNILNSIALFKKELEQCEEMIKNDDLTELKNWINRANTLHHIL